MLFRSVGFFLDFDMATLEMTSRYGQLYMDNVEVYNMSQMDTFKAAIRWENNVQGHSSVTNCAIHNGYSWALHVKTSQNVHIKDNVMWNFRPVGVGVQTSNNITIDGNVLGKVVGRTTFGGQKILDKEAGFSICAYHFPDPCTDIHVTNNIAGGIVYGGFLAPAHDCGEASTQTFFRGNVAHSSQSTSSGEGLVFFPNTAAPSHGSCFEASHFAAYKCSHSGVTSFQKTHMTVASNMLLVDNHFSLAMLNICPSDYAENEIVVRDSSFYGDSISPDCPQDGEGGFCYKTVKKGLLVGSSIRGGKVPHNPTSSPRPHYKIKTDACWLGGTRIEHNKFIGFTGETQAGLELHAFDMNPYAAEASLC